MIQTIHIALSADKAFTVPLGLCLRSIMQSAAEGTQYHFHILDSGVDRKLLMRGGVGTNMTWYNVADKLLDLPSGGRFPTPVYHRFLLPMLLAEEIKRVIYLDCDTLVQRDLGDLYNTELGGNPIAAVPWQIIGHYADDFGQHLQSFPERFQLNDSGTPYFYSSLLVMDLPALRRMQARERLVELTHRFAKELIWPDQDVLNAAFRGQITPLPLEYNVIPLFSEQLENESEEARQAYAVPAIVHYAAMKPNILTGPRNALEVDFFRFWKESPWHDRIPYPLVSLYSMPRPVAALLNCSFRLMLPFPRLLQAYGKILNLFRGRKHP